MNENPASVKIQIKYKEIENSFEGQIGEAWLFVEKFFKEFIPSFKLATKLMLNIDLFSLCKDCEGLVTFSPEGANIILPKNRITDNEILSLWFLATFLGSRMKMLNTDTLSKNELQTRLGKSEKITSTRLGELSKKDWIIRTKQNRFRLTTFGADQIHKEIIPKLKAKFNLLSV